MNSKKILILLVVVSLAPIVGQCAADDDITFEKHIRPILKTNCFHCHGEEGQVEGQLDLRLQRFMVRGGDSGPAVIPTDPDQSLIVRRLRAGEMPPDDRKKLSADEVVLIERWISAGAKTARVEPESIDDETSFTSEEENFWSFQAVRRGHLPDVQNASVVRTPIDRFVLAPLEEAGASMSAEADKATLVRRIYLNLLGLPPSPDEVQLFLGDDCPDAYERLVDRLLASPRYGERWGRHWLDVAGYADSEGYTEDDKVRSWSYLYRDYVISSLNADKPFDIFVQEQLAGDEMGPQPHRNLNADQIEKLTATGFLRMAPDGTGSGGIDQNVARNEVVADTLKIVSTSLLGLTVGCARCHNHRYDPITHADYYRMRAIFEPAYDWKSWRTPAQRMISLHTDGDRELAKKINAEAAKVDKEREQKAKEYIQRTLNEELENVSIQLREPLRTAYETQEAKRTAEQKALLDEYPSVAKISVGSLYLYDRRRKEKLAEDLKRYSERATKIRATIPPEHFIRALTEPVGHTPVTHVFFRGDHEQPKQSVEPGELSVLKATVGSEIPTNDPNLPTTGRRLAYARHLTNGAHPLVGRVIVNRIWLQHFGRGIVSSPGDFGFLGERPSHAELLDWLTDELVREDWQLKVLHRLVLNSSVYRQASNPQPEQIAADPDNRLFGRMSIRRLESEALRDSALLVAGRLNKKMFGEPVPVMEDEVGQIVIGKENLDGERKPTDKIALKGEEFRRSVYIQVRRSRPLGVLEAFDSPEMSPNCECRNDSNVAPQSLMLMNSQFAVEMSTLFAARISSEVGENILDQILHGWHLAFCITPSDEELAAAETFLLKQTVLFEETDKATAKEKALATYCQALLSANRFLYVE